MFCTFRKAWNFLQFVRGNIRIPNAQPLRSMAPSNSNVPLHPYRVMKYWTKGVMIIPPAGEPLTVTPVAKALFLSKYSWGIIMAATYCIPIPIPEIRTTGEERLSLGKTRTDKLKQT